MNFIQMRKGLFTVFHMRTVFGKWYFEDWIKCPIVSNAFSYKKNTQKLHWSLFLSCRKKSTTSALSYQFRGIISNGQIIFLQKDLAHKGFAVLLQYFMVWKVLLPPPVLSIAIMAYILLVVAGCLNETLAIKYQHCFVTILNLMNDNGKLAL